MNLRDQLERFKTKVKEMPEAYVVEHKPGYRGGGSVGALFSLLLVGVGGLGLWRSRKR